jgi:hypothetical protein
MVCQTCAGTQGHRITPNVKAYEDPQQVGVDAIGEVSKLAGSAQSSWLDGNPLYPVRLPPDAAWQPTTSLRPTFVLARFDNRTAQRGLGSVPLAAHHCES